MSAIHDPKTKRSKFATILLALIFNAYFGSYVGCIVGLISGIFIWALVNPEMREIGEGGIVQDGGFGSIGVTIFGAPLGALTGIVVAGMLFHKIGDYLRNGSQ